MLNLVTRFQYLGSADVARVCHTLPRFGGFSWE